MILYDNIHGYIDVDPIATTIIDTPVFQRLRSIHQTGVLYMVYPTANHSRFEHSIGTYHLAKMMIRNIAIKQPELNITEDLIFLVSIAGLCHDLGHMLFSHLFDDHFLPKLPNYEELKNTTCNIYHEHRSIVLLKHIVEKYNINISKHQLRVIGDLINPKDNEYTKWKPYYMVGRWIFQIISNPINSIDVDKFDYIVRDTNAVGLKFSFDYSRIINDARVIDGKICYSKQCSEDIYHMFFIRYRLHRMIYNHPTAKAIELMIIRVLFILERDHNISSYIMEPEKMIQLVDSYVWHFGDKDIIDSIYRRKLPSMILQEISLKPCEFNEVDFKEKHPNTNYEIIRFTVGYVGGKSNPLNHISFYEHNDNKTFYSVCQSTYDYSYLINQKHQEHVLRVYSY